MRVVFRPPREAVGLALVPAGVALLALLVAPFALALALPGVAVVGFAAHRGSRRGVTVGSGLAFVGVLAAGVVGADPGLLLVAAAGTVVTWTTAQHVVGLGRQLGRDAPVTRSVIAHLAGASVATCATGGLALGASMVVGGALPPSAVVFLLVGVAVLVTALET